MSRWEIYNALTEDKPKIKLRIDRLLPKVTREFKRDSIFPAWKWDIYVHQKSHNRYLISFYADSPSKADNPEVDYFAFMNCKGETLVVQWGCWPYHISGVKHVMTRHLDFYTPHFFHRYGQRIWGDKVIPYYELLCRYFSRNKQLVPIEQSEDLSLRYKKYGELAQYAFEVNDGICFVKFFCEGEKETVNRRDSSFISTTIYSTIVNRGLLSETQIKAIKKGEFDFAVDLLKKVFGASIEQGSPIIQPDNLL